MLRTWPRAAALTLAAALLLQGRAAAADVSDADRATARSLAQQGQDAFDAGDYPTAIERFRRADAIIHAPTLQLAIARAQVAQGRLVSATETLHRIIADGVAPGAPAVWAQAVADARRELGELAPRVPALVVKVGGAPAARVSIDGAPLPPAALGVKRPIDPGKHVVRAEADGFAAAEVRVDVAERAAESVALTLAPAAPPPPPPDAAPLRRTLGLAGIGVGAAALVGGAVAGGIAVARHASLAKICPEGHCAGQEGAISAYHAAGNASTALLIAGAALAGTGVALVLTAPRRKAAITPVVGLGWAGIEGRFQ